MSTSAQLAAQELRKLFVDLLPDRHNRTLLASDLSQRLCSLHFPKTPRNFEDACVLFHELFAEISHPDIVGYGYSRRPILYGNVLFAIRKYGVRLKVFRSILIRTCEEHCQYEALFAVMCEAIHHPVGYYERFNSQNGRDFMLKGMMMVRIEQRRRFPPAPNCELTYLFHFSLDDMLEMMKRKHGMSGHEERRRQMKRRLETYNTYQNEKYSEPIRRLLQEKPNFFSDFKSDLEILSRFIIREATKESFWLDLMYTMTFKLYEALRKAGIFHENKTWIIYWYIRHHHSQPIQSHESFNDMMTRIVQPGQMAFPFRDHPRLFKSNDMVFRAALKWESVPTSDLLEICYRSHVKSQYGPVPSQLVLAASIRRKLWKLYEVKITEAAVKIQKMARRSLWQFYLKRLIAAMIIKKQVLQIVTPILHVKHSKILIISAVKRFFIQKKFFERLETYRYIQQIKAGCVIFKVLNRHNHVLEYQKIRAGSIIQSRLIAIFERQKANAKMELLKAASTLSRFTKVQHAAIVRKRLQKIYARSIIQFRLIAIMRMKRADSIIERLKAASTLSRFAKVQHAAIVHKRFQNFVKNLSCYECPTCLTCFNSVEIGMIQPCGHIHCKDCFTKIGKKCSICRAQFMFGNCKSVETFLSQPNSKFFFTSENPEKKAAIEVITKWWIIKRSLLAETRTASLRVKIMRRKLQSLGLAGQ
jgi:hypothetical protein